uniref:Uncharacterized protein n=1 Tax=Kalanchoe fedtschenkoi TaxID=63787 RepID=A0A7N0UB33_KALFE
MSPNKNLLHDLLQQDQEPFHIRDYISDRRTMLRTSTRPLQLTPSRKPLSETTSNSSSSVTHFPVTFCKNACFAGKHDSPDLTRASPVVYFRKSPVKLLHIPSKTAALLLEAALRIHKNSSARRFRTDFGIFGSVFKKLTLKTRNRNDRELEATGVPPLPVKNIFRRDASRKQASGSGKLRRDSLDLEEVLSDSDMGFYCHERRSDAVWSEDKSQDTETSCSSSSNSDVTQLRRRSPDFSFLPPSPSRRTVKDEDEEEEKEQCSPVCVLDPLFEYEDDTIEDENDGHGRLQCSYASVQSFQILRAESIVWNPSSNVCHGLRDTMSPLRSDLVSASQFASSHCIELGDPRFPVCNGYLDGRVFDV